MSKRPPRYWHIRTPTVIQMEAVECGAAALGILLGHYGKYVPLEELRAACGVSRDGSNALNIVQAARKYGLEVKGLKMSLEDLYEVDAPSILFWEFNHFLVLEGFSKNKVYLNDPALGPRTVSYEELDGGFVGIVLSAKVGPGFVRGGRPQSFLKELVKRFRSIGPALAYLLIAGVCLLLPGIALPTFTRIFVDDLLIGRLTAWKGVFLAGMGAAALMSVLLTSLQLYFLNRLNAKLAIRFSSAFLWHILRLPVSFYSQRYTGEIAYRMNLNDDIAQTLTGSLATTSINLLLVLVYGAIMFRYDILIALIALASAFLNLAILFWIQRARLDSYARLQQERSKATGNALIALQQIETIKATGTEGDVFSRFAGYYVKKINAQQEISKKDALLSTCPPLLQALAMAAVLSIGGYRAMQGHLSIGMLMALQTLLLTFLAPVGSFVNFGQTIQNMKIDLGRLDDVIKNPIDPVYKYALSSVPNSFKLEGYLEMREVTFGYSPLAPPLIEGFSLLLKPGMRIALVGPTGCGKSTIAKLAAGLFHPWSGEILYDGKPRSELPRQMFHCSLSSVDQDIFLFSGTVRDNLTLWDKSISEEELFRAAHDACIHQDIAERPGGYDSSLLEGGRNWSGGQRQRLEIARSLLINPTLLILDEATSALDSETEKRITDQIRRRGCATLIIAHRLSTIQECDEIIVLDQGKIAQRGTHQELKQMPGLYRELIARETVAHG